MKLTPKQKAFADYYIECGNATEAYKRAGYKSYKNLRIDAAKTLQNPTVSAYIAERLAEIESERIATIDEVMKFYTSVMRGEEKDQFGLDASLTDRLKAGQELVKRLSLGNNNNQPEQEDDPLTASLIEEAERLNNGDQ